LPLVLLGGLGLGRLFERIPWRTLLASRDGLILAAMFGLFFGLIGVITLTARANDAGQAANRPYVRVLFILLIVVIPMAFLVYRESIAARYPRYAGWSALLVAAVLLGMFTMRSTTQLAWVRGDEGTELAAQRVPTEGVGAFINQTMRLSRDLSLTEVSNVDNTGSFGISIAVDPAVEWPFAWYFRDFSDVRVTSPAGWADADMVIAPTNEGMEDAGYIVQSRTWLNRVPAPFEDLGIGTILERVFSPSMWYDSLRFLFYRDLAAETAPEQINVGYTFRLSNQMNPSAGPFDLDTGQSLGPGSALGQLMAPTGIALSNDGQVIYIVDSGNQRIQRFGRDGTFIGSWSAEDNQRIGLGMFEPANQGASDMVVGPDDLLYIADTWNHRIMVLDADGELVRELGKTGEVTDTGDSPDPTLQPGLFYGPRSVAVANGEIYVSDTGNERVQVFATDGTFLRAFGGYGTEPGKLLEPVGIAIGPDGNVYVADTGNSRISVFAADGTPLSQIPVPNWANQFSQQDYLKFGPDGVLYISSPGSGTIQAWNGAEFVTIQGGEAGGELTAPVGMAIGADGTMLVTETQASKVRQFPIVLPEGFLLPPGATPQATPQGTSVPTSISTPVG
jgi:sugar lactone lactonase YvrE